MSDLLSLLRNPLRGQIREREDVESSASFQAALLDECSQSCAINQWSDQVLMNLAAGGRDARTNHVFEENLPDATPII
jgi:hypothetical protein